MNIIFMGTPKFAVPSLEILIRNGYNIPFVVTVPDKKQGRGLKIQYSEIKQFALNNNFEVIQPEILKDEALINKIKSAKPDLIVVVAFRILPKEIFTIPKLGTINVHASLLPKYRGAAPINWALINGEKETGVTTFLIDEKVDTGNILLQKRVDIDDTDNFESLYNKLSVIGSVLLLDTIIKIKEESITTSFQNNSLATPAPKITKEHCKINWSLKSVQIHNLIRGLSPHPAAYTYLNEKIIKIFTTNLTGKQNSGQPGKISIDNKSLFVSTGDLLLEILELQLEGKKRIKAREFINSLRQTDNLGFS